MDSRERILVAIHGRKPDRVPRALAFYHLDFESLAPPGQWRDAWVDVAFVDFAPSPEERELERMAAPHEGDTRLGTLAQLSTYAHWNYRPQDPKRSNPLAQARSLDDLSRFPFPVLHGPYQPRGLPARWRVCTAAAWLPAATCLTSEASSSKPPGGYAAAGGSPYRPSQPGGQS